MQVKQMNNLVKKALYIGDYEVPESVTNNILPFGAGALTGAGLYHLINKLIAQRQAEQEVSTGYDPYQQMEGYYG